jgi:hypothetical protein
MRRVVLWERVDTVGVEYAEVGLNPLRLQGEVVVVEDGTPFAVSYRVDCDDEGRTARAQVGVKRSGARGAVTVVRAPDGAWTVDGQPRPELAGIDDVDISITPATNTLPIRRLRLDVGRQAALAAAWIRLPTLEVTILREIYLRVAANTYEYEAPDLSFRARLDVDPDGLVRSYGGLWTARIMDS